MITAPKNKLFLHLIDTSQFYTPYHKTHSLFNLTLKMYEKE